MFDSYLASRPTPQAAALVDRICAATRAENRAAAEQLVAIGELFAHRLSLCSEPEDWALDTEAAVSAEVGAALRISQSLARSRLRYARALRERLPKVGEVFACGDIDFRMFQTIVYRSDLITDPDVLATVDKQLAANVARWPSMTTRRLAAQIDKIVTRADADAVRRHIQSKDDREIWHRKPTHPPTTAPNEPRGCPNVDAPAPKTAPTASPPNAATTAKPAKPDAPATPDQPHPTTTHRRSDRTRRSSGPLANCRESASLYGAVPRRPAGQENRGEKRP